MGVGCPPNGCGVSPWVGGPRGWGLPIMGDPYGLGSSWVGVPMGEATHRWGVSMGWGPMGGGPDG